MRTIKKLVLPAIVTLLVSVSIPAFSQDTDELDKKQADYQNVYIEAYSIIDQYPNVTFAYEDKDGVIVGVNINGIPDNLMEKKLSDDLIKLENLKRELTNIKDKEGIYYVSETEPVPEEGYKNLYRELHNDIDYPQTAKEHGVEGIVFVKFIVDTNGEIRNVKATNNINTTFDFAKEDLVKEAEKAVKSTSGEWEPAKVGDVPVNQWVYLPVKFELEYPYYYPIP